MKASHKESKFPFNGMNMKVEVGEFITGREKACEEMGISPGKFRNSIKYLENEGLIVKKTTNKFTLISIVNWGKYQDNNQPTTNQQPTNNQPTTTYNNVKNDKNDKNIYGVNPKTPFKGNIFQKPSLEEIKNYCQERRNGINAQRFIDFYEAKGWMIGKNKMKDWKAAVRTWEQANKTTQQNERVL